MNKNLEVLSPLSSMQLGMLFRVLHDNDTERYFIQNILRLENLNIERFKMALGKVVQRNAILRSGIVWKNLKESLRYELKNISLPINEINCEQEKNIDEFLKKFLQKDREEKMDLSVAPLFRVTLLKFRSEVAIIFDYHHIILDGWSVSLILEEIWNFYSGNDVQVQRPPYKDYVLWLNNQNKKQATEFWKGYLSTIKKPTNFSFQNGPLTVTKTERIKKIVPGEITRKLQIFSATYGITINTILLACLAEVISHYSSEKLVTLGMVSSGRSIDFPDIEKMIGIFINTMPIVVGCGVTKDSLKKLQCDIFEAVQYSSLPLVDILQQTKVKNLFNVLFVYENYPSCDNCPERIISQESIESVEYPFVVVASSSENDLIFELSYDTNHFDTVIVDEIYRNIVSVIESLVSETPLDLHISRFTTTNNEEQKTSAINSEKTPLNGTLEIKLGDIWKEVLKIDEIGRDDNFFDLGGNSILAIKLINAINRKLESGLKVSDIFKHQSIAALSSIMSSSADKFRYTDYIITEADHQNEFEPFPMSNVQQAYYIGRMSSFDLGQTSTHTYSEYKFKQLNVPLLERTFNQLIDRHASLRSVFIGGRQKFLKSGHYSVQYQEVDSEEEFLEIRESLSHKIYDVEKFPLFDVLVTKYQGDYILHLSFDALLADENSGAILFNEWTKMYNQDAISLEPLQITYRDYMINYARLRASNLYAQSKVYWEKKVGFYDFNVRIPMKQSLSDIQKPNFKRISRSINKEKYQKIKKMAEQIGVSTTSVVLAVYGRVLCHWSSQSKFCINMTLFSRLPLHPQVNSLVGDFTALELFNYEDKVGTIKSIIKSIHDELWRDLENNVFDGIDLQRLIREKNSISQNAAVAPIVLTSVLTEDGRQSSNKFLDDTFLGESFSITQTSQVLLDNKATISANGDFVAEWDYISQAFEQETIEQMHRAYCNILESLAELDWDSDKFPYIPLDDKSAEVIATINQATQAKNYTTITERLDDCFKNYRENTAVIADDKKYTYEQLDIDSKKIAASLIQIPEPLIAVLCPKGYKQVAAILGILRSGHAYLPLSVDWPAERINKILEASGTHTVLALEKWENKLACEVKNIDSPLLESSQNFEELSHLKINPDDVAYVIFTSGSTGAPKGVSISHYSALNTIDAVNHTYEIEANDKALAVSEISFDLSVYDIFGMLLVGAAIVFPKQSELKEVHSLSALIEQYKITILNVVPQFAGLILDGIKSNNSIRLLLVSGDKVPLHLLDKVHKTCENCRLVSLGGATEGSIWSIWYPLTNEKHNWTAVPYGYAMPNQKMYVLDHLLNHCPIGFIGDIYIGGGGVAQGYWNDETLTKLSFISHPKLGRIYKTGDLGRLHKDCYIEFLGRSDSQVKVNGYRVELEEINKCLQKLQGIESAYSIIQTDGNSSKIIIYVVPKLKFGVRTDPKLFKLKQLGIKANINVDKIVALDKIIQEADFVKRKSYRNFLQAEAPKDLLEKVLTKKDFLPKDNLSSEISYDQICKILSSIGCIKLNDRVLPKYRYPSAGSTYSVRCFLNVDKNLENIERGVYYFNPLEFSLHKISDHARDGFSISLIANMPAIKPLYYDSSERYASLETGHILYLLSNQLRTNGIGYQVEFKHEYVSEDDLLLAVISLSSDEKIPLFDISFDLLEKVESGVFHSTRNDSYIRSNEISVFTRSGELGSLLKDASHWLTVKGANNVENFITAGFFMQKFSEDLIDFNIGSCMIGPELSNGVIYSMALGPISEKEKYLSESNAKEAQLAEIVRDDLRMILPHYMLPAECVEIDKMPLSANGKVDLHSLPKLETDIQRVCIHSRNVFEERVLKFWEEVLECETLGINSDFFAFGGNSVKAINVTTKINQYFNSTIKVADLFTHSTVEEYCKHILPLIKKFELSDIVTPLSISNNNCKKMFMIHPANGGCEVYAILANSSLNGIVECWGVDSFNLYNDNNRINELHALASLYLSQIDLKKSDSDEYILFGWSLGGQIAIEIACMLEKRGEKNIKLILLDPVLVDEFLANIEIKIEDREKALPFDTSKMDRNYVKKLVDLSMVEDSISRQPVNGSLQYSKILFFKAELPDSYRSEQINKHIISLPLNNLEHIVTNPGDIKTVSVKSDHFSIVEKVALDYVKVICDFLGDK